MDGKRSVVDVARACLSIATNLDKREAMDWINRELAGDFKNEFPSYRHLNSRVIDTSGFMEEEAGFQNIKLPYSIHYLENHVVNKRPLRISLNSDKIAEISCSHMVLVIESIVDRCFAFLNQVISELQYGGRVEYLMEEIRRNTDEKLFELDDHMREEITSLFINLTSTNRADWPKVGHSCRRLMEFLADGIFPPSDSKYKFKDGIEKDVKANNTINRLCAFVDSKMQGDQRKRMMVEINYLENYIKTIWEYEQEGEHAKTIEKYDVDMIAIHTYLILSELLKLVSASDRKPALKVIKTGFVDSKPIENK